MITILVVDDEPLIREVVVDLLRDEGYVVVIADDGHAALEVVQQEAPALVLMDVMMPRMDGRAACQAMRARAWGGSPRDPDERHGRADGPRPGDHGVSAQTRRPGPALGVDCAAAGNRLRIQDARTGSQ